MGNNYIDTKDAQIALKAAVQKGLEKAENNGIKKASEYVAQKLESNTPYWDGKKYNGKRGSYMQKHAKNFVVYSKPKNGEAFVGYTDDVAWRMHFVEFGTEKQLPQGTLQKTQSEVEDEVIKIMEDAVKEAFE